uniref:Uncharacterized protein n=1 Tax=Janibacter limosus TaxID=53458 RepID=A0AC61U7U5_9MICO|nr:hypothetical protein [Janibacter limosus]
MSHEGGSSPIRSQSPTGLTARPQGDAHPRAHDLKEMRTRGRTTLRRCASAGARP